MNPVEIGTVAPVAVIGVGCRFPGGVEDLDDFWELLAGGVDAIGDIPPDRWSVSDFADPDPATPERTEVRQGGFLRGDVTEFDAAFFGMAPREAAALDPQQRVLMEVTWEALEHAGMRPSKTAGANIGTFIGGFTSDAAHLHMEEANRHLVDTFTPAGVSMFMVSARLPYTFDWHGPCFTLDTACSSSLVALHQACAALGSGECELAVAGGVNVMIHPVSTVVMSKGQFLSPDARCKPFDARANGYVRSEGAGVVVLKPLAAAQRDGDRIHAVIRGTAVNHDGRTPGSAVPSAEAQGALVRRACQAGGIDPTSIGYFEAHGTGTPVGDPIEAAALAGALQGSPHEHLMGSVKSNIGHTEAAAGIAGVIKAVLCVQRALVPPSLHFDTPNPRIPFDRLPLRVPTVLEPFPERDGPRRVSVNSFGAGGTNAHSILEQAPPPDAPDGYPERDQATLLPFSARSRGALDALAHDYAKLLEDDGASLPRVARSAARRRDHHPLRSFVVGDDAADAARRLRSLDQVEAQRASHPSVAFVYTGMGPQWWGMGAELLRDEPVFAAMVAECDAVLARFGMCMADELRRNEQESRLRSTLYAQVANFVVQAGLTALWRHWGVEPSVVIGHSVGEVASTWAAGAYSLEDALTVSYHRARLQAQLAGQGAMGAVGLSAEEVAPHLRNGVEVAAMNGPSTTTLAGEVAALDAVQANLAEAGVTMTRLHVEMAYHSALMDPIREPLLEALGTITPHEPSIPLVSTVTGELITASALSRDYWWSNVRRPVRFEAGLRRVLGTGATAVLEVGPHPVLAMAIDEITGSRAQAVARLSSLRRDRPQRRHLLENLGSLYVLGVEPAWERVHPGHPEHLDLPRYPWQRERHWTESSRSRSWRLGAGGPAMAGRVVDASMPTREVELTTGRFGYLADHRIGDAIVLPGASYLEAALTFFDGDSPCVLEGVTFRRPFVLPPSTLPVLRVEYDPAERRVQMFGRTGRETGDWTLHTEMYRAHVSAPRSPAPRMRSMADTTRDLPRLGSDAVYARLGAGNLNYGPAFRVVQELWVDRAAGEFFGRIDVDTVTAGDHRLHPAHLDGALQAVFAGALTLRDDADTGTYVPASIEELQFFRPPGEQLWVHGRDRHDPVAGRFLCDLTLVTDGGEIVAEVSGLLAVRMAEDDGIMTADSERLWYEHRWVPEELIGETPAGDDVWLLTGAACAGVGDVLSRAGVTVVEVDATRPGGPERVIAALGAEPRPRGVIQVVAPTGDRSDGPSCSPVADTLRLVQTLPGVGEQLVVVTTGTQGAEPRDTTDDPFAASLWGFARVVGAERPELRVRLVDLPSRPVDDDALGGGLAHELAHDGLEEVALRASGRFVRRLVKAEDLSKVHHVETSTDRTPVRLRVHRSTADNLRFFSAERREPKPHEVEIEVAYAGVNFKDALKVTGLISARAVEGSHSRRALGLECSGTVVRVGRNVIGFVPGMRVFAHSRDLFASHVTIDAVRVVEVPERMSLAEAAALLPVATAHLTLAGLAGVRPGRRVLVHSAAGGVGLAAVRVATSLGAEVYATAGSPRRREFLRKRGIDHVGDSRSTSFADDVLDWTGGQGVDVILNSLPEDMTRHSLRLLRPFGHFVELGKPGVGAGHALQRIAAGRSMTVHSFDYDQMMALVPVQVREAMVTVAELCEQGVLAVPPITEVPAAAIDRAFLSLGGPDHVGKVVVRLAGEPVTVPASSMSGTTVRSDSTYVITGGTGGLGRTVAAWLAAHGARHLVLVSRSGTATEHAQKAVTALRETGIDVRVEQVDVADHDQVTNMMTRVRETMPPLRGIIHAAADFDDVVLSATDPNRLIRATRPKADGAWNLHVSTAADELDFFVLFSSVGAQLGSVALGAYATANEFLNALARHRTARGLPATSIGWGMIDDVGVAVNGQGEVGNFLRHNGHVALSPERFLTEFGVALRTRPVEVSVADIDWPRWARANPQLAVHPRVGAVVPAGARDGGDGSEGARLQAADAAERTALLPELLVPLLRQTTGLSDEQLAAGAPVDVDSLTAVSLRVLLQKDLGVAVPAVKLQRDLTLSSLVELLVEELERDVEEVFAPEDDLTVHEFPSADGTTIYGHLSLPPGPGPHPGVVVCTAGEGGALSAAGEYVQVSEHAPLRAAGFAVLTVDHRGTPGHGTDFSAAADMGARDVDDVLAAARHLAGLAEVDETRISVMGTSRGGYEALCSLVRDDGTWHRGVLMMGLYDPDLIVAAEHSDPGSLLPLREGQNPTDVAAHFDALGRRPLDDLDLLAAPLLIIHGDADTVIPVTQARDLAERATRAGASAQLLIAPGLAHDSMRLDEDRWNTLWPQVIGFLQR